MRAQRWAISAFLVIGTLYVTGLVADRPLPFGGTLATASVLAIAVVARSTGPARLLAPDGPWWARWAGVAGLAALTACAALVDARHGGNGWPVHATEWWWGYDGVDPALLAEAGLLTLAGALLAVSVLGRVRRVIRPGNLPAALLGLLLLVALVAILRPGSGPAGPGLVIGLALVALALLALAVNAALLNGRPAPLAAAGLIPVVIALSAVTLSLVGRRAERASELEWQASAPAKAGSTEISGAGRPALSVDVTSPDLSGGHDAIHFWPLRVPGYPELSEAERRGLAYKASLRPPGLSAAVTIPVADDELHWWRGAAGGLLLIGLLGVALRGSREA